MPPTNPEMDQKKKNRNEKGRQRIATWFGEQIVKMDSCQMAAVNIVEQQVIEYLGFPSSSTISTYI